MKKRQGIRWKESIGNNIANEYIKRMSIVAEVIFTTVCTLVFMFSTCIIFTDVFQWGEFSGGNLFKIFLVTVLVSFAMELSLHTGKKLGRLIRWGVLAAGIIIGIGYLWFGDEASNIFLGLQRISSLYQMHLSRNIEASKVIVAGDLGNITQALDFILLIIFFVLLWGAKMLKKNLLLMIVPLLALFLVLLVGYSPEELGLILMFAGILLSNASRWKVTDFGPAPRSKSSETSVVRLYLWSIVCIYIFVLYIVVKIMGTGSAMSMVEYSDEVRQFRDDLVTEITEWSVWYEIGDIVEFFADSADGLFSDQTQQKVKLTNTALEYDYKTILKVFTFYKPMDSIYLKDFHAGIYKDGVWENNLDDFEDACEDKGYDSDEMANNIANMGLNNLTGKESSATTVTIFYENTKGTNAYLPYFAEYVSDKIYAEGDSCYRKERGLESISFYAWKVQSQYEPELDRFEYYTEEYWEQWYNEYVRENYLQVPANMKNVEKAAKEVEPYMESLIGNVYDVNMASIHAAELVAIWLADNTSYTTNPPELPTDVDPVEFFLGTSKAGYCMHYSSAAVLILRELGIPARYASGYIASVNSFERQDTGNVSNVTDDKAHAWVEIYLEGIGWIPVEVTQGFDEYTLLQEPPTTDSSGIEKESDELQQEETSEESSEIETTTEETLQDEEMPSTELIENKTDEDENEPPSGIGKWSTVLRVLIILVVIMLIILPIFIFFKVRENYRNKLLRYITKKRTLYAIKTMNRRIYRKLRITGKVIKTNMNDKAYEEILKKSYPEISKEEWEHYMEIVKAAAFSRRDFSEEEMEFCYGIYQRIIHNS